MALVTLGLGALALGACARSCAKGGDAGGGSTYTWRPDEGARGSVERGRELVLKYECNRCHDGTGHDPAPLDKHCVHCHQRIILKTYDAKPDLLTKWERNLPHLREVPSLTAVGARLRRGWVEGFIKSPHDLRPGLTAEMPRLDLSEADARDLATYLVPDDGAAFTLEGASAERGRKLVETRACGGCHVLSGAPPLPASPPVTDPRDRDKAISLAPDLRHVRGKWKAGPLVAWLVDPKRVKPDAAMPATGLTEAEARDVALYLLTVEVAPEAPYVPKPRLPVLERPVTWAEVETRVFRRTCWHCHSDPDYAIGDGGPGNTGGLGFAGVGLNVATYQGILSGAFARGDTSPSRTRVSVFKPLADGTPRIVAAMLARHDELAGKPRPDVRGMPLGLPPYSMEDIQLVESWIAQGRPQ